jgi:hypothetical protein
MTRTPLRIEVPDDAQVAILRAMTGAERLAIANRMWVAARDMLRCHLQAQHPDWDAARIARETARRLSHGAV